MRIENYFDNAATTPISPVVLGAYECAAMDYIGNPHSIHSWGREARAAVETARERIAQFIHADDPQEVVFTSGATESNNWIANAFSSGTLSPFEHSSMRESALARGFSVLSNEGWIINPSEPCEIACVMLVNNETGAILDPESAKGVAQKLHVDATQALGKIPLNVSRYDFASMSAHKLYGPKGVGALYAKGANFPTPLLLGGEQEFGFRAGTLNVAGILAFAAACDNATEEMHENYGLAQRLRAATLDGLSNLSDWQINEHSNQSPYILNLSFAGLEGEVLVIELDNRGFGISSGAACSAGSTEPSYVLTALRIPKELTRGTVRISFSKHNSVDSASELGRVLAGAVESTRKLG